jgi:hypothetical protein
MKFLLLNYNFRTAAQHQIRTTSIKKKTKTWVPLGMEGAGGVPVGKRAQGICSPSVEFEVKKKLKKIRKYAIYSNTN